MKKLFTLILLMIVINSTAQTINSKSIYNVEQFTRDCLADLNVTGDSVNVCIVPPFNKFIKAPCVIRVAANSNMYLICISNEERYAHYIEILAHELVHVSQFHHNRFKYNDIARYNIDYSRTLNYDVKYENEANKIGAELITKHLKFRQ